MWGKLAIGLVTAAFCFAGGNQAEQRLSTGSILVASDKLADPNFAESVILIVHYDPDEGTVGIVINRRTEITLLQIFPKIKHAGADPVYMGGPVGITAAQALLRSPEKTEQTTQVLGDVYLTGAKDVIEKSIGARAGPSKFRVYVGYAGWAPGQLETEIQLGAWSVMNRGSKVVFDDDPDSLWTRLTHESHMQIAFSNLMGISCSQIFVEPIQRAAQHV
jgi:putative transcriptional regulator